MCLAVAFVARAALDLQLPTTHLLLAFLVVLVPMTAGLVLSEYPRGADFAAFRLGLATFCRTGLPLVVVLLVARYSVAAFTGEAMAFLVAFYAVGLTSSIGLSLYRFVDPPGSSNSQEVDSAAA